jgi:2-polyprenyl-6-methoxyphenol hydroxylase-like FAD-dependent oxidoreductase
MVEQTQVLIVGGSLNGLTTALLLADLGVRCLVVERQAATTVQYKFAGISPRSMEIYRGLGLEEAIRARRTRDQAGEIARGRNLSDPNVQFLGKPGADVADLGEATWETCDQDRLEPILRAAAERQGATMRFHSELVGLDQDATGVSALVRDLVTGEERSIHADYFVAADGVAGASRARLGIGRQGPGELQHWMNLIFETDLEPVLQGRRFTACFVADVNGSIVPRNDRWLLAVQYQPGHGERPEDFGPARTAELVRRAVGRDDVKVELFDARAWEVSAWLADRFSAGRAFLVGDCAHSLPPTGGFGGNTGIHDAHNLAWKLAMVLNGVAGPALLETYGLERRFVAERTLAQALARLSAWFQDPGRRLPPPEPIRDDNAVIFGQVYPEGALLTEEDVRSPPPAQGFEDPRHPSGRPGTRAPHLVIERQGRRCGIHDLFGRTFVLLVGSEDRAWSVAAAAVARRLQLTISVIRVGRDVQADHEEGVADVESRFPSAYGITPRGAVLIRPDGFIAWRAPDVAPDPERMVEQVLKKICFREGRE